MDKYKNKKAELRAWAKDDIVPTDLQWLCKASADIIGQLQGKVEQLEKPCKWEYDEYHNMWETECGKAYCLTEGSLQDNDHSFCPFCGHKIADQVLNPTPNEQK